MIPDSRRVPVQVAAMQLSGDHFQRPTLTRNRSPTALITLSMRMTFGTPLRFRVVSVPELVGGKLVALLDRTAARDLYDAAALAQAVDAEDQFVRRVFVAMAGLLPRHLNDYRFHDLLNSGVVHGRLLFPSDPDIAVVVERHPRIALEGAECRQETPALTSAGPSQLSKT
jgi:hypothetical protein